MPVGKKKTKIIKEFQISHFYWSLLNDFMAAKGSILSYLRVYPSQCHDEMVVFCLIYVWVLPIILPYLGVYLRQCRDKLGVT